MKGVCNDSQATQNLRINSSREIIKRFRFISVAAVVSSAARQSSALSAFIFETTPSSPHAPTPRVERQTVANARYTRAGG